MNKIEFSIGGKSVPKARIRFSKHKIAYTPIKTKDYEKFVGYTARSAMSGIEVIENAPVKVSINVFMQIPASWSNKKKHLELAKQLLPTTTPDIDNIAKSILDGMNGIVYKDDSLVTGLTINKQYSSIPRVDVTVEKLSIKLTNKV